MNKTILELEERTQKNVDILLKKNCHFWLTINKKINNGGGEK